MNKSILIVEDEKALQNAISKKLELSGFQVHACRTVNDALDALNSNASIHAIWLDHYLLGESTGLDFVAKVKSDDQFKKIPIFVVSNTASPEKVRSYIRFGISKYYTKADHRLDEIIEDLKKALT